MFKDFKTHLFIVFLLCCAFNQINAQHTIKLDNKPALDVYQDSLKILSEATFAAKESDASKSASAG